MLLSSDLVAVIRGWRRDILEVKRYSSNTVRGYLSDIYGMLDFFSKHFGCSLTIEKLEGLSVRDFRSWLSGRVRAGISNKSNSRALSSARMFFAYMRESGIAENDAISVIKSPKLPKKLPKTVSHDLINHIIKHCKELEGKDWLIARDKAIILLLYGAGLRISEAVGLRVDSIRTDGTIVVLGKGRKERQITILPVIREAIDEYVAMCPFEVKSSTGLFYGASGKHLNVDVFRKRLKKLCRLLCLPDFITPHSFRHSFATHVLEAGGDLRTLQKALGHEHLSTTQQYTHISDKSMLETYKKFHPFAVRGSSKALDKK